MTYLFSIFTHVIAFAAGALAVVTVGMCMTAKDADEDEQHSEYSEPRNAELPSFTTIINGK